MGEDVAVAAVIGGPYGAAVVFNPIKWGANGVQMGVEDVAGFMFAFDLRYGTEAAEFVNVIVVVAAVVAFGHHLLALPDKFRIFTAAIQLLDAFVDAAAEGVVAVCGGAAIG